jgi:hypothetical protein
LRLFSYLNTSDDGSPRRFWKRTRGQRWNWRSPSVPERVREYDRAVMNDMFDDADSDDSEPFTPEQFVRMGLDTYRAAKSRKTKDYRLRIDLLRGAQFQLQRGLANSESDKTPLPVELADEARRTLEAITSDLRDTKRSNDPSTVEGLRKRLDRLLKKTPRKPKPKR